MWFRLISQAKKIVLESKTMFSKTSTKYPLIVILATAVALGSSVAMAKNGGNGQTGNGGGGGGKDTPDPDFTVSADIGDFGATTFDPDSDCTALTPDLKGPYIAYTAFYDRVELCAVVTTDKGTTLAVQSMFVEYNDAGDLTAIQLRGVDGNGIAFFSQYEAVDTFTPPLVENVGDSFIWHVHRSITMYDCGKTKVTKNTVCDLDAGDVVVGDLTYVVDSF
jgi:hypothetical protein